MFEYSTTSLFLSISPQYFSTASILGRAEYPLLIASPFAAAQADNTNAPGDLAATRALFDQLDGDVLAGGAIPRHTARLEGGIFKQGYGLRLSGNYIGEARLNGSGLPGSSDLFYGDLATFDIRVFADLGQVLKKDDGWFDGLRVSFRVDNVFDARRRVEDENGVVPDAFQPFRVDPTGRYIGVDLRKAF